MANRLYNKQVSPKGYKAGGRAGKMGGGMMKRPMMKKGGPVPVEKIKKAFPKASPAKVARMQTMLGDKSAPMKKERLFEGDRGRRKKMIEKLKGAVVKATPLGLGIKTKEVAKKIKERMGKKMGGPLKPVDPKTQKGLSKLPTEVRNKMGYMQDGGLMVEGVSSSQEKRMLKRQKARGKR